MLTASLEYSLKHGAISKTSQVFMRPSGRAKKSQPVRLLTVSPAGLLSAASTFTPKKRAAVTHLRGLGPSSLRCIEDNTSPFFPTEVTGVAEAGAAGEHPARDTDLAFEPAAFLAALAAFFAAFLLGPPDPDGCALSWKHVFEGQQ